MLYLGISPRVYHYRRFSEKANGHRIHAEFPKVQSIRLGSRMVGTISVITRHFLGEGSLRPRAETQMGCGLPAAHNTRQTPTVILSSSCPPRCPSYYAAKTSPGGTPLNLYLSHKPIQRGHPTATDTSS